MIEIFNIDFDDYKKNLLEKQNYSEQIYKFLMMNDIDKIFQEVFFSFFRQTMNLSIKNKIFVEKNIFEQKMEEGINKIISDMNNNFIITSKMMFKKDKTLFKIYEIYLQTILQNGFVNFQHFLKTVQKYQKSDEILITKEIQDEIYESVNKKENSDLKNFLTTKINSFFETKFEFSKIILDEKYLNIIPELILVTYHFSMIGIFQNQTYEKNCIQVIENVQKHFENKISGESIILLFKTIYNFFNKLSILTTRENLIDSIKLKNLLQRN